MGVDPRLKKFDYACEFERKRLLVTLLKRRAGYGTARYPTIAARGLRILEFGFKEDLLQKLRRKF